MAAHNSTSGYARDGVRQSITGVNEFLLLIGRIAIALIFVSSGAEKFMALPAASTEIGSRHLPMPDVLAVASATLELGGGILIVIGWQTRLLALALALFTAVAAYFFHDFWHYPPGNQHINAMIHFMKNISMIGGFLVLAAAGAGRYSLDAVRGRITSLEP